MRTTYQVKAPGGAVDETHVFATAYEPGGRVTGRSWTLHGHAPGKLEGWSYDALGRLSAIPGFVAATTYDAADRPLVTSYRNGTRTTRAYSPQRGWLMRLVSAGGLDLAYERDAVELTVTNEADGSRAQTASGGHGIVGMRERATLLGGTVEAGSSNGLFRVRARLPYAGGRG